MIGIVDYGMGNLYSVHNAITQLGYESDLVASPDRIDHYERLILPGVGSFAKAMENLESQGWSDCLIRYVASGRPLLGICLGMQLLFDQSSEHGDTAGLGLIPGRVTLMKPVSPHRIPHMGWNSLVYSRQHALFSGVKEHIDFYFVHSYHCQTEDPRTIVAVSDHGGEFVACAARDNVVGIQFHPEKSQPAGLKILENFANWGGQTC